MAKKAKEPEMYEGMIVIEASSQSTLDKKLEKMETYPDKYVVKVTKKLGKMRLKIMGISRLYLYQIQCRLYHIVHSITAQELPALSLVTR